MPECNLTSSKDNVWMRVESLLPLLFPTQVVDRGVKNRFEKTSAGTPWPNRRNKFVADKIPVSYHCFASCSIWGNHVWLCSH